MISKSEQSSIAMLFQKYERNGYRKRMHAIWNETGMFNATVQRSVDQKNNLKRKWPSDLKLEEIQRNIEDIGHGKVGLENYEDEGWVLGMFLKECEVVLEDYMVPNVEEERSNVFVIKINMQTTNEDMTILEKMRYVLLKETRQRMPPLRGIEKHRLLETIRKVVQVMNKIEVGNTELIDLVYAATVVVTEMLGDKNRKSTGMYQENRSTCKTIKQTPWAYSYPD